MTRRLLLLAATLLPGCTLVDQTTFNPNAGKRPTIPPAPVVAAPLQPDPAALVTVRYPQTTDLRADVAKAVAAARARKRDVTFEVVEVTAPSAAVANPGADAAEVARLIIAQGVPANRVRLGLRPIVGAGREVRIYVH